MEYFKYDELKSLLTYGMEIEAVDFDKTKVKLSGGSSWADKEVTLVNSDGNGVDPRKTSVYTIGGEINTQVTHSLAHQKIVAKNCLKLLRRARAKVNYRCNLQAHVGLKGFLGDDEEKSVRALKLIQQYVYDNAETFLMLTMGETNFNKLPEYPNSFWLHHQELPLKPWKHEALMKAETLEDIRASFFLLESGRSHFANIQRQYINLHTFFKYGTIEFRHFYASLEDKYIDPILDFCNFVIIDALTNHYKGSFLKHFTRKSFPERTPFDLNLEKSFQATRVKLK